MNLLKVAKDQYLTIGNKNDIKQARIDEELKQKFESIEGEKVAPSLEKSRFKFSINSNKFRTKLTD